MEMKTASLSYAASQLQAETQPLLWGGCFGSVDEGSSQPVFQLSGNHIPPRTLLLFCFFLSQIPSLLFLANSFKWTHVLKLKLILKGSCT